MREDLPAVRPTPRERLARLWEPPPAVRHELARQRARIALLLLLLLLVLGAIDVAASLAGAYGSRMPWVEVVLVAALGAAYWIARTGRVTAAVLVAIVAVELTIWHFRVQATDALGHTTLYFLAVPILLAGLLLPPRPALAVSVASVVAAVAGELHLDRAEGFPHPVQSIGLFLLLSAVGALALAAAALAEKHARLLHEQTQLLRQITDNIPEVLFIVAADGSRVHYTSPAYERLTGRTVAQSMADPLDWLKSVHPEDLPAVQASTARGEPTIEYRILRPSGDVRHVLARTFPLPDRQGRPWRIVGVEEDVTELRRAERRLREAQEQRIRLLQQLAHDLASPLTPLKIQLRLLRDRAGPDAQRSLDVVRRNLEHLQRLVEDVKDVARLEGGGLRLERRPMDLSALARQAAETLAGSASERGVALAVHADGPTPVDADPGRVTQALYNLVGNALKFTPAGGRVEVAVRRRDGWAEVRVRDTGPGLDAQQIARLFQPFSQVHDPAHAPRGADKGTGLGLYITKGIVEAHGGGVGVESPGPGQGATFTFRLPLGGDETRGPA